ncbi:hypothetical protein PYW07_013652 [Mythimna separata]|uniref:Uncharacterized protein n=1 Tax=Mythimna separata TaxID=271217 RepID=A0AAD8DNU1_MYTSE|nr:hypothetical protein PYW07_013652 [Mythimna separata]
MPKTKAASPARSQGGTTTPKHKKTRGSRSLCSPALSTGSGRLTSLIDQFKDKNMESFALSPLNGRSVLNDNTEIEEPRRKSWWKKLDENSQDVMEVLEDNKLTVNNPIEEFIDIDVLSQEKKNYTLDLPESSDNESIHSIVLPQRRLFTQKENQPQKKYGHLMDNRESLAKLYKTNTTNIDKTMNVGTRELFQNNKRSKPIFPAALLNISPDKTAADKTRGNDLADPKPQVRNIFGNRPANKRKNMFADFIVSESEDEIPDIQPKVFGFQKKLEQRRISSVSRGRESSPASSITTDIELDFRMMLPSSTMVENQLEDMVASTPVKRARLSKLSEAKESEAGTLQTNTISDKSKQSNKSASSKNKSKASPEIKDKSFNSSRTTRSMLKNASKLEENVHTSIKKDTKGDKSKSKITSGPNELDVTPSKSNTDKQSNTLNKSQNQNRSKTRNSVKAMKTEIEEENCVDNAAKAIDDATRIINKSRNKSLPNTTNKSVNEKERTVTIKVHDKADNTLTNEEQNEEEDDENNFTLEYEQDDEVIDKAEATSDNYKDNTKKHNTIVLEKDVQQAEINKSKTNKSSLANKTLQKPTKTVEESVESQTEQYSADDNVDANQELETAATVQNEENKDEEMVGQEMDDKANNSHEDANNEMEQEHEDEMNVNQENEEPNESEEDHDVNISQVANESQEVENENEEDEVQANESQEVENENEEDEEPANESQEVENEDEEDEDQANESQEVEAEVNESQNIEEDEQNENQEVENEDEKDEDEANESQDVENEDEKDEDEANESQKVENENEEDGDHANESQEVEAKVNDSQKIDEDEQNESEEEDNESDKEEDEEQEVENESEKEEDEANESQEVANANASQEAENEELNDSEDGNDEGNQSQEVETEVNESQEVANESQEVENKENGSEEKDEPNESQEIEAEENESQDIEEDEANESQEIEDEAHESQVDEDDEAEDKDEEMDEEEEEAANDSQVNEASANESQEVENDEEEENEVQSDAEVNESEEIEDDQQMEDSDEADKAIATDAEVSDQDDNQTDEMEVDNDEEESENEESEQNDSHGEREIEEQNEIEPSEEIVEESPNVTHDTTGRHRKKHLNKSPEVILHDKTNQMDSFTAQGRNTSVRKTKSMIKNLNIRPSLAPPRDSTGFSDETRNSSAEGSGWDSHRTTRKTLRQTFGKDFTPRKSLRALVMEKSAKRQTEHMEMHSETVKFPLANSTEMPEDSNHDVEDVVESDHELSRRTRQTTLEQYLQKIKEQNIEKKLKMETAIRNSLKAPVTNSLSLFKVPGKPAPRRPKPSQTKPKKQIKSVIPLDELPPEIIEDMKYKPPKRFQPANASWITKRLYKFLETKLEPKYDYKARVRAEKLVETIYSFAKDLRRHPVAPADAVDVLKHELARLDVVRTHFDFYEFFHDFMPREVRIKVVPDIVNKIALPRHGVFSDILRGNTVHG